MVKVKEPLAAEYGFLREDLLLFTYLHMAAAPELADAMVNAKTTGVRAKRFSLFLISFGIPINIRFSLFGSYKVNHNKDDLTTSYLFF